VTLRRLLHTNDCPSTVNRLLNMGIEPFLVASAVNLITGQRLGRRLCQECQVPEEIPKETLIRAGVLEDQVDSFNSYRGEGCAKCNDTGYKGRVGFYQVMPMFEELRELILAGANTAELKRESMRLGVKTMRQAALTKMDERITSFEETLRCTIADD
jgi:type IV pilus assembly protein PilB